MFELLEYDPEAERLRVEAEVSMLKKLRIGDRVAVTFSSKMDDNFVVRECDPYKCLGLVVALEIWEGRGHVTVHFEGEEKPCGPFSPLDVAFIGTNK